MMGRVIPPGDQAALSIKPVVPVGDTRLMRPGLTDVHHIPVGKGQFQPDVVGVTDWRKLDGLQNIAHNGLGGKRTQEDGVA